MPMANRISGKVSHGTKLRNSVHEELDLEFPDKAKLKDHKAALSRIFKEVEQLYEEYELELAADESYTENRSEKLSEKKQCDLRGIERVIEELDEFLTVPGRIVKQDENPHPLIKAYLPTIKLPLFNGAVTEF